MQNIKSTPQAISLAWIALTWAGTAAAGNSPASSDDSNLLTLAVGGVLTLLVALLAWRFRASSRAKKPDSSAFMTLEQITRLESPGASPTLMKVPQSKPASPQEPVKSVANSKQASPSDAYISELEKQYPRIVEKLVTMWPDSECENYLQSLSFDERGDREGFSREVAADIMVLYGVKLKEHGDVWQ